MKLLWARMPTICERNEEWFVNSFVSEIYGLDELLKVQVPVTGVFEQGY
jgi:hypothetical protein